MENEDLNISTRKSAVNSTISMASGSGSNKRKKDTDIICIDSDDGSEDEGDDVEMVLGEVFSLLTGDIPSTLSEDSNY